MSRQAASYERTLIDLVKEYTHRFYYENISRVIDLEQYRVKVEKPKEEMVGRAFVVFEGGDRLDYELRYNRIVNLNEGYTLLVPGSRTDTE